MTLSPDEEKLFKDPAAKELIGSNGVQATLIAASATPPSGSMPAPGSLTALLLRAGEVYNAKDFATAGEALRRRPPRRAEEHRCAHRPRHDAAACGQVCRIGGSRCKSPRLRAGQRERRLRDGRDALQTGALEGTA